jgi:hypothetical protein
LWYCQDVPRSLSHITWFRDLDANQALPNESESVCASAVLIYIYIYIFFFFVNPLLFASCTDTVKLLEA